MFPVVLLITFMTLTSVNSCDVCDRDVPSRTRPPIQLVAMSYKGPLPECQPGQYIDGQSGSCTPCDRDTFVTAEMARLLNNMVCLACQEPGEHEVLVNPCTTTTDSEILCQPGYFRRKEEGDNCNCTSYCQQCSICGVGSNLDFKYEGRPCGGHDDVTCCPWEDMVVVDGVCVTVEVKGELMLTSDLEGRNSVSYRYMVPLVMLQCMLFLTLVYVLI